MLKQLVFLLMLIATFILAGGVMKAAIAAFELVFS